MKDSFKKCYLQIINKSTVINHIKIALVVGTILNIINQFNLIISLSFRDINFIKILITYLVPFLVSVYSAATVGNSINGNKKDLD